MNFLHKLFGKQQPNVAPGKVVIDNTTTNDNWLYNRCSFPVTVACNEMFGSFTVDLNPGDFRRITFNVQANAYPLSEYSYDDLKYEIGKGEKWEVRTEQSKIIMVKVNN